VENKAILLVSFGTTFPDTRKRNIGAIAESVSRLCPEYALYQAYTSSVVRKAVEINEGIHIDCLAESFAKMQKDGIKTVYVLPTHIIAGIEYDMVKGEIAGAKQHFDSIYLGRELLADDKDYEKVIEVLVKEYVLHGKNEAVILMGHGSAHAAGEAYRKMQEKLMQKGHTHFFMGTVEGVPTFEEALTLMHKTEQKRGLRYEKITLVPFMLVAGDHANNDMAGDEDSWKTSLKQQGYKVEAICKGLGEYVGIRDIYMEHLKLLLQNK
jgi:sirohydrochlorin cobaltochelatase